jgi:hypothetical protein
MAVALYETRELGTLNPYVPLQTLVAKLAVCNAAFDPTRCVLRRINLLRRRNRADNANVVKN